MRDILRPLVGYLRKKGVQYADVRHERITSESIQVRDGVVEGFSTDFSEGVGIRVLYKGSWGFASTHLTDVASITRAAEEAVALANAFSAVNSKKTELPAMPSYIDRYESPYRVDPFNVPAEEKIALLSEVTTKALKAPDIEVAEAFMEFVRSEKLFLNTEGSEIEQTILTSGGGYHVIAEDGLDAQRRSYPDSHHGLFSTKGYELFEELDMLSSVPRVTEEARMLLSAPVCPAKNTDIIIDGPQMALQIHESCGHPAELDRVLGSEISFAGGSFLTLDKMDNFKYGSKFVNLYADPTHPQAAGSYKYDDEGVRAARTELVKEGVLTGYLSSRESAARIGASSSGCMRAEDWSKAPIVRMNNICMEPGEASLGELIADTKDGLLLSTNKSWSIDDLRLNFQFSTEIAYEIKNGKIGQAYKNPVYYGITPGFWASCDGAADKKSWKMWGLNSCAKGEPVQVIQVGHGASPARFRNVSVGVAR